MGRTVPTFVQLIQQAAERWKKFRRALRREDQPHFDRLFVRVRCYTQAALIRPTTTQWKRSCSPSLWTRKSVSMPSRKFFRTQGCFVKLLQGWILDRVKRDIAVICGPEREAV